MKESTVIKFLQDKEQSDYRLNESGEQLSDLLDEYAESHTQAHTEELRERVKELESLMREFVDRVDRGEVRSKKTYAKFKGALKS